uniref:Uncharacterized protein n=1 Tax=Anguilla anguilla TaxID=7936 RepID=A0A0E9UZP8_ANGAN
MPIERMVVEFGYTCSG